jgi:hypothetical protein
LLLSNATCSATAEVSQFDYQLPYDKYCSGVFVAHKQFFRAVNGGALHVGIKLTHDP